jgi:hypothetical protein
MTLSVSPLANLLPSSYIAFKYVFTFLLSLGWPGGPHRSLGVRLYGIISWINLTDG